jgi:FemAB-related protein (PEP-CTERM system-associated)
MPAETHGGSRLAARGAGLGLEVAVAGESDRLDWDRYVTAHPDAVGYHEWAWRGVFERTFGHRSVYLIAREHGRVAGVLPIVEMRSRLFGHHMTSLPFVNYGGALAANDAAARALLDAAVSAAREGGAGHIELRHFGRRFPALPVKQHKVTMRLPLAAGMWDRFDRKVRNQVRKAEKSELTAIQGGLDLLDDFYTVFARNMRDLGTPVYSRRLFEEILRAFPDRARLTIVRLRDIPVAAGLSYRTRGVTEVPWASSIREYNNLCPNHLLYWRIIEAAQADGCDTMDFGRSTPDEGTFKFKEQWGASPVPLYWEYWLRDGVQLPDQSPKNPKFRMAVAAWRRLPLPVANFLGPRIVRSIP